MVKSATFLQLKLTLQRSKTTKILLGVLAVAITIGVILNSNLLYLCGVNHIRIASDLEKYPHELDPESCEALVDRILEFNENCKPEIEIVDCG